MVILFRQLFMYTWPSRSIHKLNSWSLRAHFPVPVVIIIMSATSPHHPWPLCSLFPPCEQLLMIAVGGPVMVEVVEVMAILALAFPWSL
jgi:hypothetical protein